MKKIFALLLLTCSSTALSAFKLQDRFKNLKLNQEIKQSPLVNNISTQLAQFDFLMNLENHPTGNYLDRATIDEQNKRDILADCSEKLITLYNMINVEETFEGHPHGPYNIRTTLIKHNKMNKEIVHELRAFMAQLTHLITILHSVHVTHETLEHIWNENAASINTTPSSQPEPENQTPFVHLLN